VKRIKEKLKEEKKNGKFVKVSASEKLNFPKEKLSEKNSIVMSQKSA
jgi:hypothetical protein